MDSQTPTQKLRLKITDGAQLYGQRKWTGKQKNESQIVGPVVPIC